MELAIKFYDACCDMDYMDYEDSKETDLAFISSQLAKLDPAVLEALEIILDR